MSSLFHKIGGQLNAFFYPRSCPGCGGLLLPQETAVCLTCELALPFTHFGVSAGNAAERIFWGRIPFRQVSAWLYFHKQGMTRRLIHHVKYKGHKEAGIWMGKAFGTELMRAGWSAPDLLIPVPMHISRMKVRGYNQAEVFAEGIGAATGISLRSDLLQKAEAQESQTRKNRFMRWMNASTVYSVKDAAQLQGKHIALVDDVITTGATLEACAQTLRTIPGVQISIFAMALTAEL